MPATDAPAVRHRPPRRLTHWVAATAALLLALTTGTATLPSASADPSGPSASTAMTPEQAALAARCGTPPRRIPPQVASPVTGYFIFQDTEPCDAMAKMAALHSINADTAITFGSRINKLPGVDEQGRVLLADGTVDPKWVDCVEDGRTCVQAAADAVPDSTIRHHLYYSNTEHLGDAVVRCTDNGRDATVVHNGRMYQRILLPVGEDRGCDAAHDQYDLVLVSGGAADSPNMIDSMLTAADAYGIDFWIGMPVPDKDPESPWLPDRAAFDYTEAFSSRLFTDWQQRYAHYDSWVGVYQSTEIPMKDNAAWDAGYELYTLQHHLAADLMPGRAIMISPYQDARRDMDVPIEMADDAFIRLAGTAPDGTRIVISPQDSRGTNKMGVYFPDEVDQIVEEPLWDTVGKVTYSEAYQGNSGDYFASMLEGQRRLDNPDAELWINVELMQRGVGEDQETCDDGRSIAAPYERVAKQLSVAQSRVSKVIGYMYDGLMTCTN
ncbi:MAG TPA: DUF4434 domain-containing protein, partial [Bacillota bacterium]|nr:DUF4434 domain-containing protein [Bacillota bacterium]